MRGRRTGVHLILMGCLLGLLEILVIFGEPIWRRQFVAGNPQNVSDGAAMLMDLASITRYYWPVPTALSADALLMGVVLFVRESREVGSRGDN